MTLNTVKTPWLSHKGGRYQVYFGSSDKRAYTINFAAKTSITHMGITRP